MMMAIVTVTWSNSINDRHEVGLRASLALGVLGP
jgi:hypothetical protein